MDKGTESYRKFYENGDESGLAEIINDYKDGLILYLNGFVNNIHIAEELTENTFVLLGTKRPRNKGKASFKTWLYTIGRNIAIDYIRKASRKKEIHLADYESVSEEKELEDAFIRNEAKIAVHQAMKNLKNEYRQVLWLSYFENLSNKEISMVMKKSEHAIETLCYRARNALKKELEKEGFEYEEQ